MMRTMRKENCAISFFWLFYEKYTVLFIIQWNSSTLLNKATLYNLFFSHGKNDHAYFLTDNTLTAVTETFLQLQRNHNWLIKLLCN